MSTLREAALMALEFLEALGNNHWLDRRATIASLRTALEQPEQEPVAWNWMFDGSPYGPGYFGKPPDEDIAKAAEKTGRTVRLLYNAAPKREWQGLTEEELNLIYAEPQTHSGQFARAIEAKLKEKNQ